MELKIGLEPNLVLNSCYQLTIRLSRLMSPKSVQIHIPFKLVLLPHTLILVWPICNQSLKQQLLQPITLFKLLLQIWYQVQQQIWYLEPIMPSGQLLHQQMHMMPMIIPRFQKLEPIIQLVVLEAQIFMPAQQDIQIHRNQP